MILCDDEEFSADESWFAQEPRSRRPMPDHIVAQEKEMIEAALSESRGRVSGPFGAAAKLGIPSSTLDSKIRALNINKRLFQVSY